MSNSSFTGVYNEESVNKITASSAEIGSLKAGSIVCDRIENSVPFSISNHIICITGASPPAYTLTNNQIFFAVATGHLYVWADHTGAACSINVGADTSARAAELLSLFGLNDTLTARLIKVTLLTAGAGQLVNITNTATTTFTNVQFKAMQISGGALVEDTVAGTKPLIAGTASRHAEGHILVQKVTAPTAGESIILFTIIEQCGST